MASLLRAPPRVYGLAFAALVFAVPMVAYALGEFLSVPVSALFRASPLTAPTLLARSAPHAQAAHAIPALLAAAALLAVVSRARRPAEDGA